MLMSDFKAVEQPVSFIVPVFNAAHTVVESLDSIVNQDVSVPIEIIMVDDQSTDDSAKVVQQWIATLDTQNERIAVTCLIIPHGGEAAAMNAGLEQVSHPVVAWVESDVKLAPDWLNHLLPEIEQDRTAGAGGCLYPSDDDSAVAKMFGYEIAYKIHSNTAIARHITSANALYRKAVFDEIGPCRLELGPAGFDSDYNQRLRDAGYLLRCNPKAVAWHHFKTQLTDCLVRIWSYGFRRPFVDSQVLYPFDRVVGALVLSSALLPMACLLYWFSPIASFCMIGLTILAPVSYSLFLYCYFKDYVLLFSSPVFFLRSVIFLSAYACGWIYKWIAPTTDSG